jgi:heme exporter protein CcmD
MSENYSVFIFLAYGVTVTTIGVVTARIVIEYRRLRAELARLERWESSKESQTS